jgi:hypothetical protein
VAHKGKYSIKNVEKYVGDPTNIIYRSLWERRVCVYLDTNPNVLNWSSESVVVPYISPMDNRYHRYFVDFWIRIRDRAGVVKEKLIEVKPFKQTIEPVQKKKVTKSYLTEVETWVVNSAKWKAARAYCESRNWEFVIMTEKNLFGHKK